jgi:hypothetical protein
MGRTRISGSGGPAACIPPRLKFAGTLVFVDVAILIRLVVLKPEDARCHVRWVVLAVHDDLDLTIDDLRFFHIDAIPTLSPKLRKVPRRSFSRAIAFDCSSLRWVSSIRSF